MQRATLALVSCLLLLAGEAAGQSAPSAGAGTPEAPIQVMVLGTFHFEEGPDFNDVKAEEQQAELRAMLDSLAAFEPTKIALEAVPEDAARCDSLHRSASIGEILRHLNGRRHLLGLEELRMRKLELGAGSEYPGVAPVQSMYERDLRIFAHLTRSAEAGDRILVIYGTGHIYHLRDFVRNHPALQLVDPLDYL